MKRICEDGKFLGPGECCFIIAEAGVNHNGDLDLAKCLVDAAAEAGADAVKFQTFTADRLLTVSAPKAKYQLSGTDNSESQFEMIRKRELSRADQSQLCEYAKQKNITFLSTPFDEQSADFLEELGVPLFKIASGELTNLPFLQHVATKHKPMLVSTGMSCLGEVEEAVRVIRSAGCAQITLLHCTSSYPADPRECNLRAITTLHQAFNVPVGYSDHTAGIEVSVAAVALGACVLEKHFTLDRNLPGPDHCASLEPHQLKAMVTAIRNVECAFGDGVKRPMKSEEDTKAVARKSLVAAIDLPAGTVLGVSHLVAKRPGTGISPGELSRLVGRTLAKDLAADELIQWTDVR